MPQEKISCLERVSQFTVRACALCPAVAFGISLPVYYLKDRTISEAHQRSLLWVQLASICALRGETQGIWTFSTGVQLIRLTRCFVIHSWWLSSGLAKPRCLHCRSPEQYSPRETWRRLQVHFLQYMISWICKGWVDNKPDTEFDKPHVLQSSHTFFGHFSHVARCMDVLNCFDGQSQLRVQTNQLFHDTQ